MSPSKQASKDHWVETRPPGGGMQQHDGCRWNCFAWSSVGGRESVGGRNLIHGQRLVGGFKSVVSRLVVVSVGGLSRKH